MKVPSHPPTTPGNFKHVPLQVEFDYVCDDCGAEFKARSGTAQRCAKCRPEHRRKYERLRYKLSKGAL